MKRIMFFTCVVTAALLVGAVDATQIMYQTPRQMGEESALVVRGKVASIRSFWNDSQSKILTETVIAIDESYKGAGDGTARVLQLGGVVGTARMHVHGAPSWTRGEEVVLFLETIDASSYRVSGLSQGKFKVERDPVTGEAFVTYPVIDGAEVLGAPSAGGDEHPARAVRMQLDAFIDDALGRRGEGR